MKNLYLALLLFLSSSLLLAQDWTYVGDQAFIKAGPAHLTTHQGELYLALGEDDLVGRTTVLRFDGNDWLSLGARGFSEASSSDHFLTFLGDTAYVAFRDVAQNTRLTVMRYTEAFGWINVGAAGFSNGGAAQSISMAFDGDTPYICYIDNSDLFRTVVRKYENDAWIPLGPDIGFSPQSTSHAELKLFAGIPYVVFKEILGAITVMKYENDEWVSLGTASDAVSNTGSPNLEIGADGTLYVVYQDLANNAKTEVRQYKNGVWTSVGGDAVTPDGGYDPDLSLDPENENLYIAFRDQANDFKASVMRYRNDSWAYVGSGGFSDGDLGAIQLAILDGLPHVVFLESPNNDGTWVSVMKFEGSTSIKTWSELPEVQVFPNPASDACTIDVPASEIKGGQIVDIHGRQAIRIAAGKNRLELHDLPSGIYWLRIETKTEIYRARLVKP